MKIFNDIRSRLLAIFKPQLEWNYNSNKSFEETRSDLGAFSYTKEGFTYSRGKFSKTLKWEDITELNVYKKDLISLDEIRMEIVYGDKCFEISEEVPGWYQFILKTKEVFASIPRNWDSEIIQPPFSSNYKTIYSRYLV